LATCVALTVDAVNVAMGPVPLLAKPIAVLLFVQLNTIPDVGLVKLMAAIL